MTRRVRWGIGLLVLSVVVSGCVRRGGFGSLAAEEAYVEQQMTEWVMAALDVDTVNVVFWPDMCAPTALISTDVEVRVLMSDPDAARETLTRWMVDELGGEVDTEVPTPNTSLLFIDGKGWLIRSGPDAISIRGGTGCYDEDRSFQDAPFSLSKIESV